MRIGRRGLLASGVGLAIGARPDVSSGDELLQLQREPQNLATETELFTRRITPTPAFFVRSHFGPPALDRERRVAVGGLVERALSLGVADLRRDFREVTITAVLQCAGNGRALHAPRVPGIQWTHGAMGQATFTGVRLRDVLRAAGIAREAAHVHLLGADLPPKPSVPRFSRSIPIARALDPTTLLAYRMNGEELTLAHGAPLRLVVPGWAGDHWVKWLTSISAERAEARGHYMERAYRMPVSRAMPGGAVPVEQTRPLTTLPVKSVIGAPKDGARLPRGRQRVAGVAFSGVAPITKVEISLDDGKTWRRAELEGRGAAGEWTVFHLDVERAAPGLVRATARATDALGNLQPERPDWNPGGYHWNGWHTVSWEIA